MKDQDSPPDAALTTIVETPPPGRRLKRAEAARLLGMSVSSLRRREGDLIKPIIDPDGVHWFDETEVRSISVTIHRQRAVTSMGPAAGDVAADVFTLLDNGDHPVDIVKQLRVTPDVITMLHKQWAEMRNAVVATAEEARQLAALAGVPSATAIGAIVNQLRFMPAHASSACISCQRGAAVICVPCLVQRRPFTSWGVRLERCTTDDVEKVRVVADLIWNKTLDSTGGSIATMRSDWFPTETVDASEIAEIVAAFEQQHANAS